MRHFVLFLVALVLVAAPVFAVDYIGIDTCTVSGVNAIVAGPFAVFAQASYPELLE